MIIDKEQYEKSREYMERVPSKSSWLIMSIIIFSVVLLLVLSTRIYKNHSIDIQGYVSLKNIEYITTPSTGIVKEISVEEGANVELGDVLIVLNNKTLDHQYQTLEDKLTHINRQEEVIKKYIKALNSKMNTLDNKGLEMEYHTKMIYYLNQVSNDIQTQNAIQEKINKKVKEMNQSRDEDAQKMIGEEIQQLKQEYSLSSQADTLYLQLMSEAGNLQTRHLNDKYLIEADLDLLNKSRNLLTIKASKAGKVHYLQPIKTGISLQENQIIASIVNYDESSKFIEAYIPIYERNKISESMEVIIQIPEGRNQVRKELRAPISNIDSSALIQEQNGNNQSVYRIEVSLNDIEKEVDDILTNDYPVNLKIVYSKESYFDMVFKNFLKKRI